MCAQLSRDVTLTLVTALVLSRLDYCNSVLAGLPASILAPLQRVFHAAAQTRVADTQGPALAAAQATSRLQIVSPCAQSDGWPCAILPDWYADCSCQCPIMVDRLRCV